MFTRTLIQRSAGMALALVLLAACGDVGNVNVNGGDWPNGTRWTNWPWPWHTNANFTVDRTRVEDVPVEGHLRIRLAAVNGEVVIQGQREIYSVTVAAKLRVGSPDSWEDALEGLNRLDVRVTDRSDEIFVQTLQPRDAQGRQYVVNYTITVPSHMEVDVHQANGHVVVDDIEGSVFADVVNGDIDSNLWPLANGEIRLATVNGNLDLGVPRSTSAEVSARVENGTITRNNLDFTDVVFTNRSLTGTLGEGSGLIDLETGNGNIAIVGLEG